VPGLYTVRFLAGSGLEKMTAVVPSGHRWIVRDIACYTSTAATFCLVDGGPSTTIFGCRLDPAAEVYYAHWDGRQALLPGETLSAISGPAGASIMVTGYDFLA
jgi:hypothetical protein